MSKAAENSLTITMLPKLTVAQQAWLKALPPSAQAMVEDKVKALGVDEYIKKFDSLKAQMEYCLGFLD